MSIKVILAIMPILFTTVMPATAAAKPAGVFEDDDRLAHIVKVSRSRVYLGELLDDLSLQTKVPFRVDDQKGYVSGTDLTVQVRDRPVREVMKGLVELFSYRGNQWTWEPSNGGYLLLHQKSPQEGSASNRKVMLERFQADVRDYYAIARMPDDQRQEAAARFPQLFPGGRIVDPGKLDLFAKLNSNELEGLLRGEPASAPSEGLPPRANKALRFGLSDLPASATAGGVRFRIAWDAHSIGPILWAVNKGGIGGNLVGGPLWDTAWSQSESEGWRDRNDPDARAYYEKRQTGAGGKPLAEHSLAAWLKKAAELQGVNIIADPVLPRAGQRMTGAWLGATPEQTILALQFQQGMTVRKSGQIYLIRHATAKLSPRLNLVPWTKIKSWRQESDENGGFLPFSALVEMSSLDKWQLGAIQEEFPVPNGELLAPWSQILQFYSKLDTRARQRLESRDGIPLRETGLAARNILLGGEDNDNVRGLRLLAADPANARLRLLEERVKIAVASEAGERREQEAINRVWQVEIPGAPVHRRTLQQWQRAPLQPE